MSDDFDEMCELQMVGGMGSVSPLMDRPKKGRKKYYHRPIGFICDIDEMIEVDE